MLDAAHVAGGIRVNGAEQTIVDRVFVAHYASGSHGLLGDIEAGFSNELLVSESFFAEFDWGEPGFNDTSLQNGTGIEMRFYDSHFTNVIVRCTKVGIVEAGGGNVYQNVPAGSSRGRPASASACASGVDTSATRISVPATGGPMDPGLDGTAPRSDSSTVAPGMSKGARFVMGEVSVRPYPCRTRAPPSAASQACCVSASSGAAPFMMPRTLRRSNLATSGCLARNEIIGGT